ncbi:hypothetical protein CEXT_631981 [Caerostris extrusa]|uniref:Uncharacterized protein n=1 Tax=Caerostris extrusa TaxID=172846 RepID=A0AAV4T7N6_CAEEX|nr:hypothetical protein CEXT_631981 [Caerostris extrusa]
MEKNNDLKLNEVIHKRNMKVQKLFRDGLEYALNTTVFDDKKDEEASEAFNNMDDIHKKSNEMEKKFEEVLIKFMEERQFPRHLHRVLEEQKNEARSVLKEYDDIIFQLNNDLNNKSAEYRQKIELQSMQHEETRKRIESVFSELNRVGNEEICAIRKEIVKHSKFISDTFWKSSEAFFDETGADKPFDTYLWRKPSEMLSIQQLEEAFLVDQAETFKLRKNLLSEVCKLRNNLEKEKLNYNLKKQVFEQEIFFLKRKLLPEYASCKQNEKEMHYA